MKELSIEEKAKRYDEAIERAKTHKNNDGLTLEQYETIDIIFPELKESEDERIRKDIIATIHLYYGEPLGDEAKEMIAWLERRGDVEKPNFFDDFRKTDSEVEPKFKVGQIIKKEGFNLGFTIAKIEDGFYYNDEGDYFPFTDQDNWELVEQKPAWSEDDEKKMESIIGSIRFNSFMNNTLAPIYELDIRWLKSLKDRVQPQQRQEWSEEDENRMDNLCHFLEEYGNQYYGHLTLQGTISWLKSLIPHSKWKPSDEQMKALEIAIRCGIHLGTWEEDALKSLAEQLKKLRG